jgi:hypothetical protein
MLVLALGKVLQNVVYVGCSTLNPTHHMTVWPSVGTRAMVIRASIGRGVPARRIYGMVDEACIFFADMGVFLQVPNWKPFPLNAKQVYYLVPFQDPQ